MLQQSGECICVDFESEFRNLLDRFECVCGVMVDEAHLLEEGEDAIDLCSVRLERLECPSGVRRFGVVYAELEFGGPDVVRRLSCVKLCHPFKCFCFRATLCGCVVDGREDSYGFEEMVHACCIFFLWRK